MNFYQMSEYVYRYIHFHLSVDLKTDKICLLQYILGSAGKESKSGQRTGGKIAQRNGTYRQAESGSGSVESK
jgi:hypothetical protein